MMRKAKSNQAIFLAIFCTTVLLCATTLFGQTFTTLANFEGTNGGEPESSLVQGRDGALYGTASYGGDTRDCNGGCGTAFRITTGGTLTDLRLKPADGSVPAGMVLASDGKFYGTAILGGANSWGTVFRIGPAGAFDVLYTFCAQPDCIDGAEPVGTLITATNGNLYGTTAAGGTVHCSSHNTGCGTVYSITRQGQLTVLHNFCSEPNCTDGEYPEAGLLEGTDGNFYGTTYSEDSRNSLGTVFKITPNGKLTTIHTFNGTDGSLPTGTLIQATDGNLYGTTTGGCGTVYKIEPSGAFSNLYVFCSGGNCGDGCSLYSGVIQGTDGNLYGTTNEGGANGTGTVFELTLSGTLTTLYSFADMGSPFGGPDGGLVQATNGIFYGTTSLGGDLSCEKYGCGTVFSLDTGLAPFVTFVQKAGKTGRTAQILGQGLTRTTSVSFNGVPATFSVESDTFLIATVPTGATSGYVTVTTPSGVLTSNVPFTVIP